MSLETQRYELRPIATLEESLKPLNPHLDHSALPRVVQYAISIGASWAAIEETYIDRDFVNEHGILYTHVFRNVPNRCVRVHFFSRPPVSPRSRGAGYLGYTILRPLPFNAVGRTVLAPPMWRLAGASPLVLTVSQHVPHLLGVPLSVKGTPFCQQDGMMMRCAQAALWTATRIMYKRYCTQLFLPGHINSAAARHSRAAGRVFPLDAGLEMPVMVAALNELGFQPQFAGTSEVQVDPTGQLVTVPLGVEHLLREAVPFLLSSIPVIVGIPEHVVTAVGLFISQSPLRDSAAETGLKAFEDWVAGLIVHDDALAPYRIMPTAEWLKHPRRKDIWKWLRKPEFTADEDIRSVDSLLIPGTDDFWLRAKDARSHALELHLLQPRFWELLKSSVEGPYPASLKELAQLIGSDLVLRWRLINSKIFKKCVLPRDYPLSDLFGELHMPRFIWLGELLKASEMTSSPSKWRVWGEILVDSTANQFHPCVLAIHLPGGEGFPGILYFRNPDVGWDNYDEQAQVHLLEADHSRPDLLDLPLASR